MTRRDLVRSAVFGALGAPAIPAWPHPDVPKEVKAIDTHAHIFTHRLAIAPVHRYAPAYDATLEQFLAFSDRHGFTQNVLIQPSFLGFDNSYLVSAVRSHPERLRGIAVVEPQTDPGRLDELDEAGCAGLRWNVFGLPDPDLKSAATRRLAAKVRDLGWQIEIHVEGRRLPALVAPLLDWGVQVVIDHFGRPDPKAGVHDPGFEYLLSVAAGRQVWIKISGAYRNGGNGRGEQIAMEAIPLLKRHFGLDRMLWGSDWPHTQFEHKVSYESCLRFLAKMLPDARERDIVLAETPAPLFKFRKAARV